MYEIGKEYLDSLIFIRNIHKNCPLIEYLPLIFPPTKKHFVEIEELLKICQNLKLLLLIILIIYDYSIYEESIYDEEILEYGENLLKILISSTLSNIKEIRFCGVFKFSLVALEKFLETWEGTSILTSNYTYEEDDYKKLINKYKNNGVIKDFGCESYTNVANMDFKI
ncbi:unnamed protein product [Rhizophagus irregularis]|nr:unnamed protein product [Rhizophagus irregularis]